MPEGGAGGQCSMHALHRPAVLTTEFHHVIPQAWQAFWRPAAITRPTWHGIEGPPPLWDPRTVELCPTSHRNVHVWIVRLMKAATDESVATTAAAVKRQYGRGARGAEFDTASSALSRWVAAGGSLMALSNAGLWGGA